MSGITWTDEQRAATAREIGAELRDRRGAVTEQSRQPLAPERAPTYPILRTLSTVAMQPIRWHWKHRTARGKLTIVAGEPGVSKSTLWMDMVARTSRGGLWPDDQPIGAGACVVMTAEDALDDTAVPRLTSAGADLSRVHALTGVSDPQAANCERLVSLERDVAIIEAAVQRTRSVLTVIDPLGAYLPTKLDAKSDHHVRSVLAPLVTMAERNDVALLAVMHLTKSTDRKILNRILGSIGFVGSARIVLAVAKDPDRPERRLLLPVKQNTSAPAPVLAYQLVQDIVQSEAGDIETVRLEWESAAVEGVDADTVFRAEAEDRGDRDDATSVITQLLDEEALWPLDAKMAIEAGNAHGIPERTMRRTAKRLGIRIRRTGFGPGGRWVWHRPDP